MPIRILLSVYFALRFKDLNFIIPNLKKIFSKRLIYGTTPSCQQKTIITGEGTGYLGKNCNFGFKYGGFHKNGSIEIQPVFKNPVVKIGNNMGTNNNAFICAANYIEIGYGTLWAEIYH